MTIDLLPTLAKLAGAPVSTERIIDGRDMWPLLAGQPNAQAPHDALYFYWGSELHAVRSGKWKLHLPHPYQSLDVAGHDGSPGRYVRKEISLSLFDLEKRRRVKRRMSPIGIRPSSSGCWNTRSAPATIWATR